MKLIRISRFQDMGVTFEDLGLELKLDGKTIADSCIDADDLDLSVDWVAVELGDLVEAIVEGGHVSAFLTEVVNAFQIRIRDNDNPMVVTLGYERFNCDYHVRNYDDEPARQMDISVSEKKEG